MQVYRRTGTLLASLHLGLNMRSRIISSDPEVLGGTPVFVGTRVPLSALFENLADGLMLDEVLDAFPTVSREAALAALREAEASLSREQATA